MNRLLRVAAFSFLVANLSLSGCVSYDSGSDNEESSETQSIGEGAQVNQPTVTTVAGGGAQVDASNRPQNQAAEVAEGASSRKPCKGLWKPESESDGSLAYVGQKGDVLIWDSFSVVFENDEGEPEVEFCESAGLTPEGTEQVWRCSRPGGEYTGDYLIEFDGQSCMGSVTDPSMRNDLR